MATRYRGAAPTGGTVTRRSFAVSTLNDQLHLERPLDRNSTASLDTSTEHDDEQA
jgi:hypothetical protein